MEADLRLRDGDLRVKMFSIDSRGMSGSALMARGEAGCEELSTRGDIIWAGLMRCYRAYQNSAVHSALYPSLANELLTEGSFWIRDEAQVVADIADSPWTQQAAKGHVPGAIYNRRDDLIRKLKSEVDFFMRDLNNPQSKPESSTTLNVTNLYGSVQTGAYSQANITINASNSAGLIEALTQLRTAFAQDTTLPAEHRNEAVELINETISTAGQPQPSKLKLMTLLSGMSLVVNTVAKGREAWAASSLRAEVALMASKRSS